MRCTQQGQTTGNATRGYGRVACARWRDALKGTRKKVELSSFITYHLSAQSSSALRSDRRFRDRNTHVCTHTHTDDKWVKCV